MKFLINKKGFQRTDYFKIIMRMAIPIIIQGLVFQLQSIVDKAFLGKLSTDYLSAVGIAQLPYFTTADALFAVCTGLTIIVSQKYGAGKIKEISESVNAAVAYNTLFSIGLFVVWFIFPTAVFKAMSVDSILIPYCNDYVRYLAVYFLVFGIDMSLQEALQGMGKTRPIMYVGLVKVFLNIFLDWIMIFGKLGFPAMYVKGAALATTVSNFAGTIILLIYFLRTSELSSNLKIREIIRFRWSRYREIIRLGLPTGTEYFLWNISNLILVSLLNKQGLEAVAVYTVTFTIEIFVYMIFNAFARTAMTLVGQYMGREDERGAKRLMSSMVLYSMITVTIFCIIFIAFPKPILSIFTRDTSLIKASVFYLILRALTMYPKALNVVVGNGIRAMGDVRWMLCTQIFGSVFVVAFSYTLVRGFGIGAFAIYLTLFMDEFLRAAMNTIRFYRGKAKRLINLSANPAE